MMDKEGKDFCCRFMDDKEPFCRVSKIKDAHVALIKRFKKWTDETLKQLSGQLEKDFFNPTSH